MLAMPTQLVTRGGCVQGSTGLEGPNLDYIPETSL